MTVSALDLAQGETRIARIAVTDVAGAPTPLDGLTLHLVVADSAGTNVTSLCKGTGAGIEHDVETGAATVTWTHADSLGLAVGTYSWSLWSLDEGQSPAEYQQITEWSPFYLERGIVTFPA